MSTPSISASTYRCSNPKINGEKAEQLQSVRIFVPALNTVSNIRREANELHAGRPAPLNSTNGADGNMYGFSGLNPNNWIMLTTGLRQVEFQANYPNTTFYDTIGGANRSNFPAQFTSQPCEIRGPESYTSTPVQNNCYGQTSQDRTNYLKALNSVYRSQQGMY